MSERRKGDPQDFRGADFRADEPTFRLGYKEASLSVKGMSVFIALAVLSIVGSNLYAGMRLETALTAGDARIIETVTKIMSKQEADHGSLRVAQGQTSCILTMTQEYRAHFRMRYQAGAFKQECPWIGE